MAMPGRRTFLWLVSAAFCAETAAAPKAQEAAAWRKPGLWAVSIHMADQSATDGIEVLQCSAPGVEPDVLLSILPGQENCAPIEARVKPGKRTIGTRCRVHDMRTAARLELVGDFSTDYRGKFSVSFTPADARQASRREARRFEARWLGPCRPGMMPGDMILSNGVTVNVIRDKLARDHEHDAH